MNVVSDASRQWYCSVVDGWNRFWFRPADPATLGTIRILAGAMILYTHLVWSRDLLGFFGPQGRLPAEFAQKFHGSLFAWSYLYWIQSPVLLWIVHIAALIIIAMFMLGLFSRVTGVLTFLITVSYANRAAGALFGLDQINVMLALYLAVGPAGAAYSLDRSLAARRNQSAIGNRQSAIPPISIRLIQLHMCVIYLFAGLGKLFGETWWNGEAMWGALANYEYQSLDMTWLATHPLIVNAMTLVTIFWEVSYAALVWPRATRPIVILLAIPLHLGIALCMGMMTFGLVMLIGNLAFVSPELVRAAVGSVSRLRSRAGQGAAAESHTRQTARSRS